MRDIPRELRERIEAGGSSLAILEALLIAAETRSVTDNDILPVPRWLVREIVRELVWYFRRTPIRRGRTSNPVSRAEQDDIDAWYWGLIEEYRRPSTESRPADESKGKLTMPGLRKTGAIEAARKTLADVGRHVETKALRDAHARVEKRIQLDPGRYAPDVIDVILHPERIGEYVWDPDEHP